MNKLAFILALLSLAAYAHLYHIATETEKILYNEKEMSYTVRRTLEGVAECKFMFVDINGTFVEETQRPIQKYSCVKLNK